jgi:hypothetical protein
LSEAINRIDNRIRRLEEQVGSLASAQAREIVHLRLQVDALGQARQRQTNIASTVAALGFLVLVCQFLSFLRYDILPW